MKMKWLGGPPWGQKLKLTISFRERGGPKLLVGRTSFVGKMGEARISNTRGGEGKHELRYFVAFRGGKTPAKG